MSWLTRIFAKRSKATQDLYDEILYLSARTQSFEALLTTVPDRIRAALDLASFHIFLREQTGYVLQPNCAICFPASSSTVSRMRRDRKPAVFTKDDPDAWQLLAEPFEIAALTQVGAQILVPLEGRTGLMGFATISRANATPFSKADLRFLRKLGPELGRGLESAQFVRSIAQQAVEQARAHRELELAREVQDRLLPAKLPHLPGLDVAAAYRSAEQIGGDYYDLFPTHDGRLCLCVADVCGKGIPAALLMATLRASLHALLRQPVQPIEHVMADLNTLLYEASTSSRYATAFVCLYDAQTGELTYVNAGHNPPIVHRRDATLERLTEGGMPLGLLPTTVYTSEKLILGAGELLIAYTDGVTEANDATQGEWGSDALDEAIRRTAAQSAATQIQAILAQLDHFVSQAPQNDDITLLIMRRTA